jgi:hypothetical protein
VHGRRTVVATFEHHVITSTRHEWHVPAAEPWGAASEEIGKAWVAAETTYREVHGLPKEASLSGDAIRFHVTDDAVVLTFTHDTPKDGTR